VSHGNPHKEVILLVFDPGASTGFAAFNADGKLLVTDALSIDELGDLVHIWQYMHPMEVVIESSPQWSHNSPVTRLAENFLRSAFPSATLIPPSRWKSHPASHIKLDRNMSIHERDAVRLGTWYLAKERK
jgi:predicted RNase H-like nuclease (RuvC/YqgF family)